jgi:transcriptional regulator with XRE-family HTH domain
MSIRISGDVVRRLRLERGWTQEQLAAIAERSSKTPIANVLSCSILAGRPLTRADQQWRNSCKARRSCPEGVTGLGNE